MYDVYTMKRKQIYLTEEQERRLKELAVDRRVPEAALIREALNAFLDEHSFKGFDRMEDSPLWALVGLVDSPEGPTDGALNHDHYLYGGPKKYRMLEDGGVERVFPDGRVTRIR